MRCGLALGTIYVEEIHYPFSFEAGVRRIPRQAWGSQWVLLETA